MNSTAKAAVISLSLVLLLGCVLFIVLSDGDDKPSGEGEVVLEGEEESGATTDGPATETLEGDRISAPPQRGEIAIKVTIVDADSDRTLARANLRVSRKVQTERGGDLLFTLPREGEARGGDLTFNLKPGNYSLAAFCSGYASAQETLTLIDGQESVTKVIRLGRGTSISGRVLSDNGTGIGGAQVAAFRDLGGPDADLEQLLRAIVDLEQIQQEVHNKTVSDSDGFYQIDGLTAGLHYTVRAVAENFSPGEHKQVQAPRKNVDFKLLPGAILEGVVRDSSGNPIEGATVEAYTELANAGLFDIILLRARPPVGVAKSGTDGRYHLSQLGAGLHSFRVHAPRFQMHTEKSIRISQGSNKPKDFRLEEGSTIRGVVRGPDDQPLEGAKIKVNQIGGGQSNRDQVAIDLNEPDKRTDENGFFEFDTLADGSYMMIVFHDDYQSVQRRDVRPSEAEIEIKLPPGGQIEGQVVDRHTGEAIPGAVISVSDIANFRKESTTDGEGRYLLSGVNTSRSKLSVNVKAEGYGRFKDTIRASATRKVRKDFELAGTGIVIGQVVLSGEGVPGAHVEVRRAAGETGAAQILASGLTDQDGSYTLEGVEPSSGLRVRVKKRTFLDGFGEEFAVASNETVTVGNIELRLGGGIQGMVTQAAGTAGEGQVIVGCMVQARAPGETDLVNQNISVQSGADGMYQIQGLESGHFDLVFKANGFVESVLANVEVREGQVNTSQNVQLEEAGSVGGRVTDPDGNPISGAEIVVNDFADGVKMHRDMSDPSGTFFLSNIESKDFVEVVVKHAEYGEWSDEEVKVGDKELTAVLEPLGVVIGRVVDNSGALVTNFSVSVQPLGDSTAARKARSKLKPRNFSDGSLDYRGIPEGEYDVHVRSPIFSTTTVNAVVVRNGETIDLKEVVLLEGGRVTGRVVDAVSGNSIPGARVRIVQGSGRFVDRSAPTSNPIQTTREDGSFVFTGMKDGVVTVEASHADYGTKRLTDVDTKVASKSLDLEIALEQGGQISGQVFDSNGAGVGGMTVYLQSGDGRDNRSSPTDADGGFLFTNVSAGNFTVKAHKFKPGQKPIMAEEKVRLEAGDSLEVNLEVPVR